MAEPPEYAPVTPISLWIRMAWRRRCMTLPGLYTGMPMVGSGATSCNATSYWMISMLVIFGLVRMVSPTPPLVRIRSCSQRFQHRLGLLEVGGVKALGEPAVDRGEQVIGCSPLALALPQAAQARGGTEFPRLGLLAARHREGLLEAGCGLGCIRDGLAQQQL